MMIQPQLNVYKRIKLLKSIKMLKVGDRVKFLNAVGGGKVTGFLTPKMVNVEDDQGFEVPCLITELVRDKRYEPVAKTQELPVPAKGEPPREKVQKKSKTESLPLFASSAGNPLSDRPAYYLAFVPEVPTMPLSGEIKAWLVNDSKHFLLYHLALFSEGSYASEKSGRLAPYSRIPLKGFGHHDFSNFPDFGFQIMPFETKSSALLPALVKTIKINPVKFYKETSYTVNSYFEKKAMLLELQEKDLSLELARLQQHDFSATAVLTESGDHVQAGNPRKREAQETREVDLHIQELVESSSGLSNKEILDIQMERFVREMEEAIRNGIRRIVFIHGVGQGTLKNELRRELEKRFKKYDVQDASFREYGYGATMVILRKG
jgi:hypothetical protein